MSVEKHFRAYVLVIDDNITDTIMLEAWLKTLGCCVDITDDRYVDEKLKNNYDIIFIDINLPSMSGFALADKIRKTSLINREVPIIAISGNPYSREQVENCMENGLDGYLEKPAENQELLNILSEFIPEKEVTIEKFSREGDLRLKGFIRKRKAM